MSLLVKRLIRRATNLVPNRNHSDYCYGASGTVRPGNIRLVEGIGPYRPQQGSVWLEDESRTYWEVSDEELQKAL